MQNNHSIFKNIIIILVFIINFLLIIGGWYYLQNQISINTANIAKKNIIQQTNVNKIKENNLLFLCLQNIQYANMLLQTQGSVNITKNLLIETNQLLSQSNSTKFKDLEQQITDILNDLDKNKPIDIQGLLNQINTTEQAVISWLDTHPNIPNINNGNTWELPELSDDFYQKYPWLPKFWLNQIQQLIKNQVTVTQYDINLDAKNTQNIILNQDYLHFICQRLRWALLGKNDSEWQAALGDLLKFLNNPILTQMPNLSALVSESTKIKNIKFASTSINLNRTINSISDLLRS
jgi:hypothetical protein